MNTEHTIASYLIDKLQAHGVRHIFGVPGDYALGFFKALENSPLGVINTSDEQGAGFAADAYARVSGLGAVCVTYCVGGFKLVNTTAQAYAEKSPVIVISGAPGISERVKRPLLHHKARDFDSQLKVFQELTAAATILDDAQTACSEIDRVFEAALRYKRPVYIELPRDMVSSPVDPSRHPQATERTQDAEALREAVCEATEIINAAEKPLILAGVEVQWFGLQPLLRQFLETSGIPVASTILSKSVLMETHPQYLGVYEGSMGREDVKEYVESSDCLILLGVFMSDFNLGLFTAHLDQGKSISVTSEKLSVHWHNYEGVEMEGFLRSLAEGDIRRRAR